MSDTFEQKSTLQYESYNDISKPVLIDGLLIHDPKPRVENTDKNTDKKKESADAVMEGYTGTELTTLYNSITDDESTARKYDMDTKITHPPTHPDYKPTTKELVMTDINQLMDQQYNTILMTVAATASLGLIVFMLTSESSSTGP